MIHEEQPSGLDAMVDREVPEAVKQERERCAQLCESLAAKPSFVPADPTNDIGRYECDRLNRISSESLVDAAAEIRKGTDR